MPREPCTLVRCGARCPGRGVPGLLSVTLCPVSGARCPAYIHPVSRFRSPTLHPWQSGGAGRGGNPKEPAELPRVEEKAEDAAAVAAATAAVSGVAGFVWGLWVRGAPSLVPPAVCGLRCTVDGAQCTVTRCFLVTPLMCSYNPRVPFPPGVGPCPVGCCGACSGGGNRPCRAGEEARPGRFGSVRRVGGGFRCPVPRVR